MAPKWKILPVLALIQIALVPTLAIQCSEPKFPLIRKFSTLAEFQGNKIPLDALSREFAGNYIRIEQTKPSLERNDFIASDSNYTMRLYLSDTNISTIGNGTFTGLFCLRSLDLQNNRISSINADAFKPLPHLTHVNLTNNALKSLPTLLFTSIRLKTLDLSRNRLQHFNKYSFDNLVALEFLNLSRNELVDVDFQETQHLASLKTLDLSFNRLTRFELDVNITFKQLYVIELKSNQLKDLKVFEIRLHAPFLAMISLENNPWLCDDLSYMVYSLRDSHIIYSGRNSTNDNVAGIDCIRGNGSTMSGTVDKSSITSWDLDELKVADQNVLRAVADVKSLLMYLVVFFVVFVVFEVAVRTNVIRRFKNIIGISNGSVENIRLLPTHLDRL